MNSDASRRVGLVLQCSYILLLFCALAAHAEDPIVGYWHAYDDRTKNTAVIKLEIRDGILSGTIVKLLDEQKNEIDPECSFCPGKRVKGTKFLTGLRKEGERWVDGTVVDMRPYAIIPGLNAECELELRGGQVILTGWPKYFRFPRVKDKWEKVANN